jgi:hypothetical protein
MTMMSSMTILSRNVAHLHLRLVSAQALQANERLHQSATDSSIFLNLSLSGLFAIPSSKFTHFYKPVVSVESAFRIVIGIYSLLYSRSKIHLFATVTFPYNPRIRSIPSTCHEVKLISFLVRRLEASTAFAQPSDSPSSYHLVVRHHLAC